MIEGTWTPVAAELHGQSIAPETIAHLSLMLTDESYELRARETIIDEGRIELSPGAMRIIGTKGPNAGRAIPAIFKLDGGAMTICYNLNGESLPPAFTTAAGSDFYLVTYERRD